MLKIGKLYSSEEYCLLLYPDKGTATGHAGADRHDVASALATHWTKQLGKPVSYLEKSTPILVLNMEKNFVEVLGGDRKGWIIIKDFLNIKEIE